MITTIITNGQRKEAEEEKKTNKIYAKFQEFDASTHSTVWSISKQFQAQLNMTSL